MIFSCKNNFFGAGSTLDTNLDLKFKSKYANNSKSLLIRIQIRDTRLFPDTRRGIRWEFWD
jgi:hypothetical protein